MPGRSDEAALALDLETVRENAQAAYGDIAERSAVLEAVLSELDQEAVVHAGAMVGGPWWSLDADNPVEAREPGVGSSRPDIDGRVMYSSGGEERAAPIP